MNAWWAKGVRAEPGFERIAILNVGALNQWRIARRQPQEVSYCLIEQPYPL